MAFIFDSTLINPLASYAIGSPENKAVYHPGWLLVMQQLKKFGCDSIPLLSSRERSLLK
jgi:hypothetical protein